MCRGRRARRARRGAPSDRNATRWSRYDGRGSSVGGHDLRPTLLREEVIDREAGRNVGIRAGLARDAAHDHPRRRHRAPSSPSAKLSSNFAHAAHTSTVLDSTNIRKNLSSFAIPACSKLDGRAPHPRGQTPRGAAFSAPPHSRRFSTRPRTAPAPRAAPTSLSVYAMKTLISHMLQNIQNWALRRTRCTFSGRKRGRKSTRWSRY